MTTMIPERALLRAMLLTLCVCAATPGLAQRAALPRTADGKPDLQGIWQVENRASYDVEDHVARHGMPAGRGVVVGGAIPYQPWAAERRRENFAGRATLDPVASCYLPGVPRIMYMDFPFQIFQTREHVAMTFEWSQVYRLIYLDEEPSAYAGVESWMGHSRGRWEGDTFVVEVADQNDQTWLDASGNFHSEALHVTERYTLRDADTIAYEAAFDDPEVYTQPWSIRMELHRRKDIDRILEYQCQAEAEEESGDFERDARTWYPAPVPAAAEFDADAGATLPRLTVGADIPRRADGKPDLHGYYMADAGGANYGLETRDREFLKPGSRGAVVDPPDGTLPYRPWARAERIDRDLPHRGYDDPTAHCFVAGIPRSHYVPSPFFIVQTDDYVVELFERMSWRQIPLARRPELPDHMRLWQGNSVGRWDGDTLVVESSGYNGKTWLNEVGDVISHAQTVVETFTPVSATQVIYRATVTDPIPYTRPWTIEIPLNRQEDELLEVACHEDNGDLQHLKDVRDEYRATLKQEE
jgi:hypothetical protein